MAVAAMSEGQNKTLHSFFAKPKVPQKQPSTDVQIIDETSPVAESSSSQPDNEKETGDGRRKTRGKATKPAPKTEPSLESAEGQDTGRRKRRKLSLTEGSHVGDHGSEDVLLQPSSPPSLPPSRPDNQDPPATPKQSHSQSDANTKIEPQSSTPPKKMLKLSAGGTLISPTSKPAKAREDLPPKKPAKRGRPKKEKHRLAVCRYPKDGDIGSRIDGILEGSETFELPRPPPPTPPQPKPAKPAVFKPTHPFFSGKPKEPTQKAELVPNVPPQNAAITALAQSPRRPSAVTPGKLRAQARENAASSSTSHFPQFGTGRDKNIVKQPGMVEAPFPAKGFAHVRGDFQYHPDYNKIAPPLGLTQKARKMKQTIPILDPAENVLLRYERRLKYKQQDRLRPDGFYDPPSSLRVPSRHLIPGSEIQLALKDQLSTPIHTQDTPNPGPSVIHPACQSLYDSISSTLTPFDEGRSEIQAWAQKYSPKLAVKILQRGKDATYLRDWMKALTISAVETTGSQVPRSEKADRERKPKKKRRKKTAELDDFIVNDDFPVDDASDELMELNDSFSSEHGRGRSFARAMNFDDHTNRSKVSNSVLISGPSGCGKTAMVYAVAKELGFEIFEISPGSRRSGKDVLDKIGDMVENHLVQNHSADAGNTSADEDAGRLSDAFNKDLESGRQGTMTSFFMSKPKAALQPKKKEAKPKLDLSQAQKALSIAKPSRGQKQSLILLEEVDIMFEEDKNFWQTIFTLLQTSKRPVIMTCNDEDLVPIQAINYQALLRLSAPSADLAVDYLLLMAGREGHLLQRDAVSTLYSSKKQDLRASIAELQLWCQMGVGDPRGGLSWIYQRWPPGSGTDRHGQAIRVTSKDTYQPGMGFLVHDLEAESDESCDEERLKDSWETWNIDPRDKLFSKFAESSLVIETASDRQARMAALKHYSSISDSMSSLDVFCKVGLPGEDNAFLDSTQPELPEKTRANYINGMALLQTPNIIDYSSLDTRLAVSTSCLISQVLSTPLATATSELLSEIAGKRPLGSKSNALCRADFSLAFDSLASQPNSSASSAIQTLCYSILDGPLDPITTDIAPYVRSIAAYDLALEAQRAALHGTGFGAGSLSKKRARTTRAARSALEGGQRQLTRRERWYDPDLDLGLVLSTGGDWPRFETGAVAAQVTSPGEDTEMKMDVA